MRKIKQFLLDKKIKLADYRVTDAKPRKHKNKSENFQKWSKDRKGSSDCTP